ncbi:hypothetical protein J4Q44_G00169770 [Coregonus suidteri]|uniref:Uncharacterized protein n=1 Tax=Coregonus suidteri TaxID=861788 RepID=A0AAN8QUH7_9TELE
MPGKQSCSGAIPQRRLKAALPVANTLLEPCVVTDMLEKLCHRRQVSKFIYDKSAKDLPELRVGEAVRMKTLPGDRKGHWRLGSCVQKVAPRSYLVEVNGSLYRRNRVDLRVAEPVPTQNPDGHRGRMTKDGTPASHVGPEALGEAYPTRHATRAHCRQLLILQDIRCCEVNIGFPVL